MEGCGQGQLGANWGDGFVTEPSLVTPNSVNDPTGFFTAVVENGYRYGPALFFRDDLSTCSSTGRPERHARYNKAATCWLVVRLHCRVVVSPHVYPPTITLAESAFTGPTFWTRMSYSFGYFNTVRPLLPYCAAPSSPPAFTKVLKHCLVFSAVLHVWMKVPILCWFLPNATCSSNPEWAPMYRRQASSADMLKMVINLAAGQRLLHGCGQVQDVPCRDWRVWVPIP